MSFLLDTNVLSEFQKPSPDPNVVAWLTALDEDNAFISVVSLAELRRGVALLAPGPRRARLDVWLRGDLTERFAGRILDITPAVAHCWGELLADAKRRGVALHAMDGFILATAKVHDLRIVTRNTRDFSAFDAPLLNPWRKD